MSRESHLLEEVVRILRRLERRLILTSDVDGFAPIKEIDMVPLAAGQTATFATTPLPANAVPTASGIAWSSSDTVNAPVTQNSADSSGLSATVTFPSTVAAGVAFSLTVSYTNSDGTTATQTNSFTTVAPPPTDVTGFTDILQTA